MGILNIVPFLPLAHDWDKLQRTPAALSKQTPTEKVEDPLEKTHCEQALMCSAKNTQSGPSSHRSRTTALRHQSVNGSGGWKQIKAAELVQMLLLSTASYDYLKQKGQ